MLPWEASINQKMLERQPQTRTSCASKRTQAHDDDDDDDDDDGHGLSSVFFETVAAANGWWDGHHVAGRFSPLSHAVMLLRGGCELKR